VRIGQQSAGNASLAETQEIAKQAFSQFVVGTTAASS
jgi:hypothetical protein